MHCITNRGLFFLQPGSKLTKAQELGIEIWQEEKA